LYQFLQYLHPERNFVKENNKKKKRKIAKLIQEGNTGNTFSVFHLKDNNINN